MPTPERLNKINHVVANRQKGIIVLEDIHDPHNAQAVVRSCDSFGFQTIYFIFENEKQFNPEKVGKLTSSAANKWVDYKFFESTEECYAELKKQGYEIWATVLRDDAEDLYQTDITTPNLALAFGNEHAGLTQYAMDNADRLITIPMHGMTQSFNLSVTASIFMFEITRQRKAKGLSYAYDESYQAGLKETFLSK